MFAVLEDLFEGDPEAQRRLVEQIERDLLDASFGKRDQGEGEQLARREKQSAQSGEARDEL